MSIEMKSKQQVTGLTDEKNLTRIATSSNSSMRVLSSSKTQEKSLLPHRKNRVLNTSDKRCDRKKAAKVISLAHSNNIKPRLRKEAVDAKRNEPLQRLRFVLCETERMCHSLLSDPLDDELLSISRPRIKKTIHVRSIAL